MEEVSLIGDKMLETGRKTARVHEFINLADKWRETARNT